MSDAANYLNNPVAVGSMWPAVIGGNLIANFLKTGSGKIGSQFAFATQVCNKVDARTVQPNEMITVTFTLPKGLSKASIRGLDWNSKLLGNKLVATYDNDRQLSLAAGNCLSRINLTGKVTGTFHNDHIQVTVGEGADYSTFIK